MNIKEYLIKQGWTHTGTSVDVWFRKEGNFDRRIWTSYEATIHYNLDDYWMRITLKDVVDDMCIFSGICPAWEDMAEILRLTALAG